MKHIVIGVGNCGTQITKNITYSPLLDRDAVSLYAIDSQVPSTDLTDIGRITIIPIISDENNGSGRDRKRGEAMFKYHEEQGRFDKMYAEAVDSKSPVIIVTSAAGGTGSGSCVPLCEALIARGLHVIPMIICPNNDDPDAYHLNTNDLMIELAEVGVQTYCIFKNAKNTSDYTAVNNEVVRAIEIVFGKKYNDTDKDSIDDSDLINLLSMPGRFIAVSAESINVEGLRKEITRKVLNGSQPAWTTKDAENATFMSAASLKSAYADADFGDVFADINGRIKHSYDQFKNICVDDNNGSMDATIIIAGLPPAEMKVIECEFKEAAGIAAGMNKSVRPSFMNRKKAVISTDKEGGSSTKKFSWK